MVLLKHQFVTDVTARFRDAYEDHLSSLLQIKHVEKVQTYIYKFELGVTQVILIPEHFPCVKLINTPNLVYREKKVAFRFQKQKSRVDGVIPNRF
jgi:hypothetical protein